MAAFSVSGAHVVVVGSGRSGRAAADLLIARGARVTIADEAASIEHAPEWEARGVTLALGPHDPALFSSADMVVVSPGVSWHHPALVAARAAGVTVMGEVELAAQWLEGRVIAITGTKGKSTTTTLVARMLTEAGFEVTAGGNLGTALSSQVASSRPESLHVVEVSSFQLEGTAHFHPWIAVFLNLAADHLDRHGSLDAYGQAKARIFANQTPEDWAVVNADDPAALALARGGRARRFDFGFGPLAGDGVTVEGGSIVEHRVGPAGSTEVTPLVPVDAVQVTGRHLLADVLAAAAAAAVAGVSAEAMTRAVLGFAGLEHALETVATVGGVRFVNDSKATNIVAARRALESFDSGVVVILGGRLKAGAFEDLRDVVAERASAVIAIGESRSLVNAALSDVVPVDDAATMAEAVARAFARAVPGGTVLLAPACASFDMFRDYAERGRVFKDEVRRLELSHTGARVH